jgi:hypothetical protein
MGWAGGRQGGYRDILCVSGKGGVSNHRANSGK